tara:strand:- start:212 stop:352 length:141 start_codon:yes stop_codon:yes gene_type:complete
MKKKLVTKTMYELQFGIKDFGQYYVRQKEYYIKRSDKTINGQKLYA